MAQLTRARWVVRGFYLITLHFAFERHRNVTRLADEERAIDPLWPVAWVDQAWLPLAQEAVVLALLVSALVAIVAPDRRPVRVLVALFFLQTLALENSFGSINHYGHLGLWLAIAFACLPTPDLQSLRHSRLERRRYLTLFFLAQALVAVFYTSSGLLKAYSGFVVPAGAVSSFAPEALPLLVVRKWLETGASPLLAEVFMEHIWLAWPVHLTVIYVELFALVAIFRPALHVLWGTMLIVFHLMVWLLLGITFAYQPVFIGLIFVCSPFTPRPHPGLKTVLRQLPLFGDLAALLRPSGSGGRADRDLEQLELQLPAPAARRKG